MSPRFPVLFSNAARRRGIALLVTIILLSFLVLIMVAMSSLVRVETKIATNQDTLAQARQNALMGLNVALGKLQETAGPDQRVTARADVMENDGAVITPGREYQMNMTGVWDTSGAGAPRLITWLVNGNEDLEEQDPNIEPDSAPTVDAQRPTNQRVLTFDVSDAGPAGTADHRSNEPLFDDVNPLAATFDPTDINGSTAPDFQFGDGRVYLVANGSVDVSDQRLNGPLNATESYKHAVRERVLVRKTPVIVDGGKLPGKAAGSDVTIGHYAYWVGDAGVKASLSAANRVKELDYSGAGGTDFSASNNGADPHYVNTRSLQELQLQGGRFDMVFRPGLRDNNGYLPDLFSSGAEPDYLNVNARDRSVIYGILAHPNVIDSYSRLFALGKVSDLLFKGSFTGASANPSLAPLNVPVSQVQFDQFGTVISARLRQLYHDITPQTYSVLTNMLNGGLRNDLSQTAGMASLNATQQPGIQKFAEGLLFTAPVLSAPSALTERGLLRQVLTMPAAGSQPAPSANTSYPIAPVVSEFSVQARIDATTGTAETQFLNCRVELWNPYGAQLRVNNTLHLEIVVTDDPDPAETTIVDSPPTVAPIPYSAEQTMQNMRVVINAAAFTLEPGEVRNFTLTIPARPSLGGSLSFPAGSVVNIASYDRATLTVRLQEAAGAGFVTLSEYSNVSLAASGGAGSSSDIFYEFKLIDWSTGANEQQWLAFDPRGPSLTDAQVVKTDLNAASSGFGDNDDVYEDGRFVPLFDVPRQEVVSVGSLRHVIFPGQPLYAVGRAGNNAANNLFETTYFSSIPKGNTVVGWTPLNSPPLANTSVSIVDITPSGSSSENDLWTGTDAQLRGLTSARSAQYVLVKDTLNVNSTSDIAWRSLLAGTLPATSRPGVGGNANTDFNSESNALEYVWRSNNALYPASTPASVQDVYDIWANWRYYGTAAEDVYPVRNVFFRIPHTAKGLAADYNALRDTLEQAPAAAQSMGAREIASFRVGMRELSRTQVEQLAWWVAYRVKNPPGGATRPFKSLTDFINEGVLNYAINQVGQTAPGGVTFPLAWTLTPPPPINNPANGAQALPIGSPGSLTQQDILELIGHRLFARSDTFVIRAYGDVNDPDGAGVGRPKILSRVWVEATVQRMPMKHPTANQPDDNISSTGTGVGNFGRQFRIISLRWLRPEEV